MWQWMSIICDRGYRTPCETSIASGPEAWIVRTKWRNGVNAEQPGSNAEGDGGGDANHYLKTITRRRGVRKDDCRA